MVVAFSTKASAAVSAPEPSSHHVWTIPDHRVKVSYRTGADRHQCGTLVLMTLSPGTMGEVVG